MFRSLLYDHPQGSSFVLSALPLLSLFASSSCLFGMSLYVVYVCVCVPDVPVCEMSSGRSRPDIPQTGTSGAHTHTHTHTHTQTTYSHIQNKQLDEANKRRSGNALSTKNDP
jgi:hypothetical protein